MFKRILLATDFSPHAEVARQVATQLARQDECQLLLLTVLEPLEEPLAGVRVPPMISPQAWEAELSGEEQELEQAKARRLAQEAAEIEAASIRVTQLVREGDPDKEIVAAAKEIGADLIVMTAYGHSGIERLFVSDIAERTIRKARTPVLLIRPEDIDRRESITFSRLLVGLDGSRNAESTLRYARMFAQVFDSELLLLGVPEADFEEPQLVDYLEKVSSALRKANLKARALVTGSGAARTIEEVSESEASDLVILAKNGRGGSFRRAALGSVAARAIQTVECPILLIDTSEFGRLAK